MTLYQIFIFLLTEHGLASNQRREVEIFISERFPPAQLKRCHAPLNPGEKTSIIASLEVLKGAEPERTKARLAALAGFLALGANGDSTKGEEWRCALLHSLGLV